MPTVDVSLKDMKRLLGSVNAKQLEDLVLYAKGEVEAVSGGIAKIDIKDTNRPDLWSAEGIAREIRLRRRKGMPRIKYKKSGVTLTIEPSVKTVRPLCYACIVRNVRLTEDMLVQLIHLQEKMNATHGRQRRECGIGLYDFSALTPPLYYRGYKPHELSFAPLGFSESVPLDEILRIHPKGRDFAHLLEGQARYPIVIDSKGVVGAMPPIINSEDVGKLTTKTRDIFIEATGFKHNIVMTELLVAAWALADRGGTIETVDVVLPNKKRLTTPDFRPKSVTLSQDYARTLLGLDLTQQEIISLLERSGYHIVKRGPTLHLEYASYRDDIMHPIDVVEDLAITYGYNRIPPEQYRVATIGGESHRTTVTNRITDLALGMGYQEIMSYTLTNKASLIDKMLLPPQEVAEIQNPVSANWSVLRNWMLPSLLEFLVANKHVEYPQRIFEIGDCVLLDNHAETRTKDVRKIALAISDSAVNYEMIASVGAALVSALDPSVSFAPSTHPSFLPGRAATIRVDGKPLGIMGEVHPQVLNNWGIEKPVAALELDLSPFVD